jgi:hypothetical protein
MSKAITAFDKSALPAEIADLFDVDAFGDDLSAGVTGGFGVLSIRGSKWRIKHGGEESPVLDENDEPKASLDVVLLKASPYVSRNFYEDKYAEGDAEAPDCFSLDGRTPDISSRKKQAETCASCPNSVWGSRITEAGKKSKACADARRVAVVPLGDIPNEVYGGPMLLRIPVMSLADLSAYGKKLKGVGIPYNAVGTKLSFDIDSSYPKLLFKAVRKLTTEELIEAGKQIKSDTTEAIINTVSAAEASAPATETPTPVTAPVVEEESIFEEEAPPPPTAPAATNGKKRGRPKKTNNTKEAADVAEAPPPAAAATDTLGDELDDLLSDLNNLT